MIFKESETVELKANVVDDICKEVVAFANSKGGVLYIGVNDSGEVLGTDKPEEVKLQVKNKIRDKIKPDLMVYIDSKTINIDDKEIVAFYIQKGSQRPYYLADKGLKPSGVYVRNGTSSDPSSDSAIRAMIKESDGDNYESTRSLNQNLSFEFAKEVFKKKDLSFSFYNMKSLGLISKDDIFLNAALLISDECPFSIKVASFNGKDKKTFQDRKEYTGSLFKQMEDTYAYLDMWNKTTAKFDGMYRIDSNDYPKEAIREALINSIIHRDYSLNASNIINIYEDRMEFISIGGLVEDITLTDIYLGLSICRNPKIASVFYRLELIEAYGMGIAKIFEAYKESGLKPNIETSPNVFKITLPNINYSNKSFSDTSKDDEGLILKAIKNKDYIVRSDIEEILNVSQSTANRYLKKAIDDGLLFQSGAGKSTKYFLK